MPELSERAPDLPAPLRSDPEMERYRLFDAVAGWLAAASADEPLLLVLDDVQWAAKPTLMLLRHAVRAAGGARVLVLVTYRDTELTHDHPLVELVADLRRQGGVERLSLTGLDDVGVRTMVERASGQTLDEAGVALARAVYQETEGNPFFVREVLRHLAESGAVERRDGGWTTSVPVDQFGIPEGVRDVVGRRLARLSSDTNHVLRIAAVAGPEFEFAVVQAAGDLTEETVLAAVEEAVGARVALEVSATRFRFAHALVRATLYESLTAARQATLHRRTAEAIESVHASALDDYVPALAHHWAKASAPVTDIDKAVEYARRAGDRALAQLAHDEAVAHYAAGLDLLDSGGTAQNDRRRVELLIGRGEAQRRASDPAFRQTLLDAARLARQLGDADALARAALANTYGYVFTGVGEVDRERVEMLEAAIAVADDDDLARRARLLATLGLELNWEADPRPRMALSEEALRLARSLDDADTLASVLLARDYTITGPENVAERFANTTELLAMAERTGDPVLASRALGLRFKAAIERADVAEAERCVARRQTVVPHLGQPALTWATLHHHATLRVLRDEPDAEAAVDAAHNAGMSTWGAAIGVMSIAHRLALRLDHGGLEAMIGPTRDAVQHVGSTRGPMAKALLALLLAETGQIDEARVVFDELAATGFAQPTNNVAWLRFTADCAWLAARLGRKDSVPELWSRLEPYADQLIMVAYGGGVSGNVAFYLGLLATTVGDWGEAEARFAAAEATHERIAAPTWLARTRLEWGRMLLTRSGPGDGERAESLLRLALDTARERSLPNIERDAVALLNS